MPDFRELEFRAAFVELKQVLSPTYRALVALDGPWVHMQDVQMVEHGSLEWQPHADLSFNAETVARVEWTTG